MPDERNEGNYKSFSDVFGNVTTEEHRSEKNVSQTILPVCRSCLLFRKLPVTSIPGKYLGYQ